jgi:hypothetical protein
MPSYAHYYQTLIPHMPVPPGSIHLHKHSPSVLTSLSGSRQQAGSGSLRARSWCWTLSGRNLFQQQPPPSPRERSHTGSITTRAGHQATRSPALCGHHSQRKYKHSLSNRLNNGSRPHSDGSRECMMSNSRRGRHRLHGSERR